MTQIKIARDLLRGKHRQNRPDAPPKMMKYPKCNEEVPIQPPLKRQKTDNAEKSKKSK